MADDIKNILIPILREIQSDIGVLKADVGMLKESVRRIDSRIGAMENLMSGFYSSLNWHGQDLDEHRGRLEALEKIPDD